MIVLWCNIEKITYTNSQIFCIELLTGTKTRKYLHEKDLVRHLTGLLLAEYGWYVLMGDYGNKIENCSQKPQYSEVNGKHNWQFNISHSEDIVVCAIGQMKVGIDIEKVNKFPQEIVEHIFDVEEKKYCLTNNRFAYKIWTRKESYLKATGEGISGIRNMKSLVYKDKLTDVFSGYEFHELLIDEEYETVVCLEKENEIISLMEVDRECLIKYMEICKKRKHL